MANNESNYELKKSLFEASKELDQASIEMLRALKPQNVFRITLDLTKERVIDDPYIVNKAFKSVFVESSTDPSARIFVRPTTNSSEQDYFGLGYKDSWTVSSVVPKGFFHWPAQNGTMTLVFFSDSEFRSGSQVSLTSGGVSISEGSSFTQLAPMTLAATTKTQILPQNFLRKVAMVTNRTAGDLYIGGPSVSNAGADEGFSISVGATIEWRNSSALYAYSPSGGKVLLSEQT